MKNYQPYIFDKVYKIALFCPPFFSFVLAYQKKRLLLALTAFRDKVNIKALAENKSFKGL